MNQETCPSATQSHHGISIVFRLCMIAVVVFTADLANGAIIAHWSFDTSTITVDGSGNVLTAADDTGVHNATGVRNGTAASASVAGQFGAALQLNNTQARRRPTMFT
jgi:hypothetical protein